MYLYDNPDAKRAKDAPIAEEIQQDCKIHIIWEIPCTIAHRFSQKMAFNHPPISLHFMIFLLFFSKSSFRVREKEDQTKAKESYCKSEGESGRTRERKRERYSNNY